MDAIKVLLLCKLKYLYAYSYYFHSIQAAEKLEANLTVHRTAFEDLSDKMVIISSDFKRAIETAQIMHNHFKLSTPIKTEVSLRERDFGEFDCTAWKDALPIIIENDKINPSQRICGCESVSEMVDRVTKVLKTIEEEYADKIVVIVSHSNPLQILWAMCNKVPLVERFVELKHFQNCDIREYKIV